MQSYMPGRHFLQIPGPTNVPDRVLRAISRPTIDHRGPEFRQIGLEVLQGIKTVFKTTGDVVIYPSSGNGAWEASLVNTLSQGDRILIPETGHFSALGKKVATKIGLEVDYLPGDWRHPADLEAVETRLRDDLKGSSCNIKAVAIVHNETSTGCVSDIKAAREILDSMGHPALLIVDTVSSLGVDDYRHDEWGVDVALCASQKGLLLPPGLSFVAISKKALQAKERAGFHCAYWDWNEMLPINRDGFFPYTPAINLLFGLKEALSLLHEEGLDNVFARHARHAAATRKAIAAWGLENQCLDPMAFSNGITGVRMPEGQGANHFRKEVLSRFNLSLGNGLSKVNDQLFRIGHLGDFNDLMLLGTLGGIEMGLEVTGSRYSKGGVQAAINYLASH